MVREIEANELDDLLELYLYLRETAIPEMNEHLKNTWETIVNDKNYHIIVNKIDGKIVSSCVCVIIPNLTRNVRPYGFIENVVTHSDHRGKGYATECLKNRFEEANIEFICESRKNPAIKKYSVPSCTCSPMLKSYSGR